MVHRDDLLGFARRDWQAIRRSRLRFWAEQYRRDGGAAARRAANQLHDHARRLGSGTPADRARAADLADHLSLRERLDRAARAISSR